MAYGHKDIAARQGMHFVHNACAAHTGSPCLFSNDIHVVQLTSFQQPKEVTMVSSSDFSAFSHPTLCSLLALNLK